MAIPTVSTKLVPWATTFLDALTTSPANYQLDVGDLPPLTAATNAFLLAQSNVSNPATRSHALVEARNAAQQAYYDVARTFYDSIQSNVEITNENKVTAGVHVRPASPTPIPVPSTVPNIDIVSVTGSVVSLRIYDSATLKRGRPSGVQGANVYTYVGTTPPASIHQWMRFGQVTRTDFDVEFPSEVEPGSKVWFTAAWYNPRGQTGMFVAPISTHVQFGGLTSTAAGETSEDVRIAA